MDSLAFSLTATLPIFLTMLLGFFFRQIGLMDERFSDYLNTFVFRAALPVLLFLDIAEQDFAKAWNSRYVLFCFVVTAISIAAAALVARLVVRGRARQGEFVQVAYRSSAAILGLAFIQNIYGSAGTGMAALMILGSVPLYNVAAVVVLTLTAPEQAGPAVLQEADGQDSATDHPESSSGGGPSAAHATTLKPGVLKKALYGIVTNPIILGIVAGFVWSLPRLPMPQILESTLHNLAVLATPLGLMAMGASLKPSAAAAEVPAAAIASLIKLVVLVAVFMPLAIAMGFRNEQLVSLLVMLGSASTVSCYIMARNLGHEGTLTATTVAMTTFGCAFTLTAWLAVLRAMGLV